MKFINASLLIFALLGTSSTAAFAQSDVTFGDDIKTKIVYVHDTVFVNKDTLKKVEKGSAKEHFHRFDRNIQKTCFVPKGTWTGGLAVSFRSKNYDNINMLVLQDVKAEGYNFSVSPHVGYFFKNNMSAGLRFIYSRDYVDLSSLDLNLGGLDIKLRDLYYLQNNYKVDGYFRTYMSIGSSKIFGLFNEIRLGYGYSQGKNSSGAEGSTAFKGTYQTINDIHLGFAPGIAVFVQDFMAIEAQLGIMGVAFNWRNQTLNQVEQGSSRSFSGKFNIDIFSISIGSVFYL